MFTDLSLQVALGRVPSSLTSKYRLFKWVRQSGQLQSLPISLYRSPIACAKFTDLSLQITPYKEDGTKLFQENQLNMCFKIFKENYVFSSS